MFNSLEGQILKDFEIIIVDDCGNDNSVAISEKYAKTDSRIRIIRNSKIWEHIMQEE